MSVKFSNEEKRLLIENKRFYNVSSRYVDKEIRRCEDEISNSLNEEQMFREQDEHRLANICQRSRRFYKDLISKLEVMKEEYHNEYLDNEDKLQQYK